MELELNSLDWNGNELEHELELEDMKRISILLILLSPLVSGLFKSTDNEKLLLRGELSIEPLFLMVS